MLWGKEISNNYITPLTCNYHQQIFSEGIVFGCVCFLMVVDALSLEWLNGSQPNFNTRWRGGIAQTLLKMGDVGLTVWQLF